MGRLEEWKRKIGRGGGWKSGRVEEEGWKRRWGVEKIEYGRITVVESIPGDF